MFCQSLPELQLNTLHGSLSGHGPLSPTLSDCHDRGAGHSSLPQHEPHVKFLQHILIVLLRGTSVLSWNKLYEQIVILLQFYFTCHLNHGGRLQSFSVEDVIWVVFDGRLIAPYLRCITWYVGDMSDKNMLPVACPGSWCKEQLYLFKQDFTKNVISVFGKFNLNQVFSLPGSFFLTGIFKTAAAYCFVILLHFL